MRGVGRLFACWLGLLALAGTASAQDTRPPQITILDQQQMRGLRVRQADELQPVRGRVTDESEIARVTVNGVPVQLTSDGKFELRLDLKAVAEVVVEASDVHGNAAQERVSPGAGGDEAAVGRYVGLVIGIDRYEGSWPALENAVRDAKAVAELLATRYGFDEIITMYDEAATRDNIISQIEALAEKLGPDDHLLIYYSGHGQLKEQFDRGYWVPVDATTNSIKDFIPNTDIQTWIGGIGTKHTLLVADACFAGDVFRSGPAEMIAFEDAPVYYDRVQSLRSRKAITSGGIEQVQDGGGDGHSVFASYLLKALRENERPRFDAYGLFERIALPVKNNSVQTPQFRPILKAGDEGGQFVFRLGGRGQGSTVVVNVEPPAPGADGGTAPARQVTLDEGLALYGAADYDGAAGLFAQIARDTRHDADARARALHYLARAHIALSRTDDARAALTALLDLKPGVKLDPDAEPPPLMAVYYGLLQDRSDLEVTDSERLMKTVAVIDFQNNSFGSGAAEYDPLQQGLSSFMANMLAGNVDLQVVERERLQWLLKELELQRDPRLIDQQTAVQAGKLLGAHAVLMGTFIVQNGKRMFVGTRLVRVETGEVLLGEQLDGKPDDFYELIEKLTEQVAEAVNARVKEDSRRAEAETKSLDAMLAYARGITLLDDERYAEAYGQFLEALKHDPDYERARTKAESLRPILANS